MNPTFLETPADLHRLADLIAERVGEKEQFARSDARVVDANGLAAILKVSKSTVERETRKGAIPSFHIGDLRRYDVQKVLDHMHSPDASGKASTGS